jgi:DNA polymerase
MACGERIPEAVLNALTDPEVIKVAWNAQFERVCIGEYFNVYLPVEQWECAMTKAAMFGLPLSLDAAAKVLKMEETKMAEGKKLIRYFSMPCKPGKSNGGRTRNHPAHDREAWNTFKEYCKQDVMVEYLISDTLKNFRIPETEKRLYRLDQKINDRGILIDLTMACNAIRIDEAYRERLIGEAVRLTGLDNPNSVSQLKAWLEAETATEIGSLSKATVQELLGSVDSARAKQALELRKRLSKTSVKKYAAMLNTVRKDGRAGGLFQFYGANRTGRWSGRLIQLQNLPQNHLPDLDDARKLVREGDGELLEMLYGGVSDVLSQLIRTAFTAKKGYTFTVADFSAIEARVIAWLAGEKWRLDVFNSHGKIYEASAAQMFRVPIDSVTKGSPLRQKGKVAELACGYAGGVNALKAMGADKMGLSDEELQVIIDHWRKSNPAIVRLWRTVNDAAMLAVEEHTNAQINRHVLIRYNRNVLYIDLPSGRSLCYIRPRIGKNRFGGKSILYEGMDQTTKKWSVQETFGGKLVENIVQGLARDCLADAMLRLDKAGYRIVMHVHDEVVIEHADDCECLDDICRIMGEPIAWAKELPLRADGYVTNYYKKD